MTKSWKYWLFAGLAVFVALSVVYLQANVQQPATPQPLITEALINVEKAALTVNGYDFPESVPQVTLGMTELAVVSATESAVLTGLPELLPGTYLLAATWPEGVGAVFFLTVGAVGPPGPPGPPGGAGVFLSSTPESPHMLAAGEQVAADADTTVRAANHANASNTHLGERALESVTTGTRNTAVGERVLRSLTTGRENAGFGWRTLPSLKDGRSNLAIGTDSMVRAIDASFNAAIGSGTLKDTLSGQHNVAIGAAALLHSLGDRNVGIGRDALRLNKDGFNNIAIGYRAGAGSLSGSNNIYVGHAGVREEQGTIRIGTPGVHKRIYLSGEIVGGGAAAVYQ